MELLSLRWTCWRTKERANSWLMGLESKIFPQWSEGERATAEVVVEVGPSSVITWVKESLGRLEDQVANQRCN